MEGERSFVGLWVAFESPPALVTTGRLFLGLLVGKGGRAVVGGSMGGRDKMGRDVGTGIDMLAECGWNCNLR
jgi:hypothetical protein